MTLPTFDGTGGLVADPDIRFTQSGAPVANARLGFSKSRKNDAGEWETVRQFFVDVAVWERAEEFGELTRGTQIHVVGQLETQEWADKNDGSKRSKPVLQVEMWRAPQRRQQASAGFASQPVGPQADTWGGQSNDPPF